MTMAGSVTDKVMNECQLRMAHREQSSGEMIAAESQDKDCPSAKVGENMSDEIGII